MESRPTRVGMGLSSGRARWRLLLGDRHGAGRGARGAPEHAVAALGRPSPAGGDLPGLYRPWIRGRATASLNGTSMSSPPCSRGRRAHPAGSLPSRSRQQSRPRWSGRPRRSAGPWTGSRSNGRTTVNAATAAPNRNSFFGAGMVNAATRPASSRRRTSAVEPRTRRRGSTALRLRGHRLLQAGADRHRRADDEHLRPGRPRTAARRSRPQSTPRTYRGRGARRRRCCAARAGPWAAPAPT